MVGFVMHVKAAPIRVVQSVCNSIRVKCNVSHASSSTSNGGIIWKKNHSLIPRYMAKDLPCPWRVSTLPASLIGRRLNNYDCALVTRCKKKRRGLLKV